jgi:alkylation response protein AidB-like acyl-CoA dehydrogenase
MFDFETGAIGKRNGVYVTNVEHKMGLNVSSTCEMNLGEKEPAVGYLLGEVHDGIAQMFKIIEFARMMVGTKAISTLSAGYQQALSYAKTRVQGGDMKDMANKASPRVTIINHPDVRRSLMTQKAYAEGMRALVLYTASIQDEVLLAKAAGKSEDEIKDLEHLNDLLLPIVKGYGSERAWTLLGTESPSSLRKSARSLQVAATMRPRRLLLLRLWKICRASLDNLLLTRLQAKRIHLRFISADLIPLAY